MKKIFLTASCFSIMSVAFSQTTTVTENWSGTTGPLTTSTIIFEGKRVYHGPYSYTGSRAAQEGYPKGNMSIKGTKKYGKMDGDFTMSYLGGNFIGDLNFRLEGKLADKVMVGTWKIKSKCRNIDSYDNDLYTYDKNYSLTFNNAGQIISGTRNNNASGAIVKFQTDDNGFLHGKQTTRYKEGSYFVDEFENYFHGILVSKYKQDVASNQLLGKLELFADTNLVNENNYSKNENAFVNVKYTNILNSIEKINDSLKLVNLSAANLYNSKEFNELSEILVKERKYLDSISAIEINIAECNTNLEKYKSNSHSEGLYNYLTDKVILNYDEKTKKTLSKLILKFIESGKMAAEDKYYFVKSSAEVKLIHVKNDGVYSELLFDDKSESKIQKLTNDSKFSTTENQRELIFELTGLDEIYFLNKGNLEIYNDKKNELSFKRNEFVDKKNNFSDLTNKLISLEGQSNMLNKKLKQAEKSLASERKFIKIKQDGRAYESIFSEKNEMGNLLSCLELKFTYSLPLIGKLE